MHFNISLSLDAVVILEQLDKVYGGFFDAVFIIPPAATWSHVRHVENEGQSPMRSWKHTRGFRKPIET